MDRKSYNRDIAHCMGAGEQICTTCKRYKLHLLRYDSNEHRKYPVFYLEPMAKKNTCGLYEEY